MSRELETSKQQRNNHRSRCNHSRHSCKVLLQLTNNLHNTQGQFNNSSHLHNRYISQLKMRIMYPNTCMEDGGIPLYNPGWFPNNNRTFGINLQEDNNSLGHLEDRGTITTGLESTNRT